MEIMEYENKETKEHGTREYGNMEIYKHRNVEKMEQLNKEA